MADPSKPNSDSGSPQNFAKSFAEEISAADANALPNFLDDSRLDDEHLCVLLARKDLPGTFLDELTRRRELLHSYSVIRALSFHPSVPRKVALRLLRELHLMDLMKLSQAATAAPDLQRSAEEHLIARLPHVTLGQKIALARQASARILAALIVEGNAQVVEPAVENPRLTEAQVLKLLARDKLPLAVVPAFCRSRRWTSVPNVALALLRYPHTPPEAAVKILPHIASADLRALAQTKTISQTMRRHMQRELAHRSSL
ncbi:MAG TPA: hypothetical protein VIH72_11655 [Candidatus Acidoferrales bacterium]